MKGGGRVAPGAATEIRVWKRKACPWCTETESKVRKREAYTPQGGIEKNPWGTFTEASVTIPSKQTIKTIK